MLMLLPFVDFSLNDDSYGYLPVTTDDNFAFKDTLDNPDDGVQILLLMIAKTDDAQAPPTYDCVISNILMEPAINGLYGYQNPGINNYLDLYVTSDRKIYDPYGVEGPQITGYSADDTMSITMPVLYNLDQGFDVQAITYVSLIDYTDDRTDPLKGIRFNYNYGDSPQQDSESPDYYVQEFNLSGYMPIKKSSIALNWYRAGATVRKQGNTDLNSLIALETARCYANCDSATINSRAKNQQALNRYGSAGGLGGPTRLRSFAQNRYSGPQVAFRGIEYRWNFSDKETPIEYYIISDTAINFQLAFFMRKEVLLTRQMICGMK